MCFRPKNWNTWERIGTIPAWLRSTLNQMVRCSFVRQCCRDSEVNHWMRNENQFGWILLHSDFLRKILNFHFHLLSSCSANWFKLIAAISVSIVMPLYRSSVPLKTSESSLILKKSPNDLQRVLNEKLFVKCNNFQSTRTERRGYSPLLNEVI